jgi:hypothetical protein
VRYRALSSLWPFGIQTHATAGEGKSTPCNSDKLFGQGASHLRCLREAARKSAPDALAKALLPREPDGLKLFVMSEPNAGD